jgi:choline dehydrogenase-like flavoprotein
MVTRAPIVVIGGGTAGCTVVSHLAAQTTRDIVLVEPGAMVRTDENPRFYDALEANGVTRERDVVIAQGRCGTYREARALGGGSAINGMLLTGEEPLHLRGLTRMATTADCGMMGQVLLHAGGEFSRLWWNRGRWNPGRAVNHLIEEGRIRMVSGEVEVLSFQQDQVASVVTSDSEIATSHVVLCAGAIATPALLLRSGCGDKNSTIGVGLQNHPCISVPFDLGESTAARFDASVMYRFATMCSDEISMFAFERASTNDEQLGVVTVALMTPQSRGAVTMRNGECSVDFNVLDVESDRQSLTEGVEALVAMLGEGELPGGVHIAEASPQHFSLHKFAESSADTRAELLQAHVDVLSHATSSCAQSVDERGAVLGFGGVTVADASVLPRTPNCTPAAPVTIEALRIARILGEELS